MGQNSVQLVFVDDEVELHELFIEITSHCEGWETVAFPNVDQALSYIQQNKSKVGMIFSDFKMPEKSGFEPLQPG